MSTHDKWCKELKTIRSFQFQMFYVTVKWVKCQKKKKDAKEDTAWLVMWGAHCKLQWEHIKWHLENKAF